MSQGDLVGAIGDGLVGRGAGATDRDGLHSLGQHRKQRHFPGDIRRDDRRDDRTEHQRVDLTSVEVRALDQLRDARLAEIGGRDVLECGARTGEGCPHPCHDRYAPAVAEARHGVNILANHNSGIRTTP